ncbi:hypothetical protein BDY24DRAFT_89238 [Mrakia frigida]|uniref:uncharacterized protein n=1 Tax=Mrakia frigida TaxID=29902 RepID=UPI003FCC1113
MESTPSSSLKPSESTPAPGSTASRHPRPSSSSLSSARSPPPSAQKQPTASTPLEDTSGSSKSSLGKRRARSDDESEDGGGGGGEEVGAHGGEGGGDGTKSSTSKRVRFAQDPLAVVLGEDPTSSKEVGDAEGRAEGSMQEDEPTSLPHGPSAIASSSSSSKSASNSQAQPPSSSSSSSSQTASSSNPPSQLITKSTQTSPSLLPVSLPVAEEPPKVLSAAERLRADQVVASHNHSDPSLFARSQEYWKEDGNVFFLHDKTIYKFHRSTLTEESDIFRSLFLLPPASQDGALPQGTSEANPIRWSGPAEELEVILWARYRPQLLLPDTPALLPRFLSLLKAARKYDFPSLRIWSLALLQPLLEKRAYASPIWLLKAGLDCEQKEWVYKACEELIVEGKGSWGEMQAELMELGRQGGENERELERGAVGWLGRIFEVSRTGFVGLRE